MDHGSQNGNARPHENPFFWIAFAIRSWSASVEVFLRSRFGKDYFGLPSLAVLLLIPLYCTLCRLYDIRPMFYFLYAFLGMSLFHRIAGLRRLAKDGFREHTRYYGDSWLAKLFPRLPELTIKRIAEPLFLMTLGVFTIPFFPPLGVYLMIGGVCVFISVSLIEGSQRMRALEMHNAVLEQEDVAERFREMRGE